MNWVSHYSFKSQSLEMTHGNRLSLFPFLNFMIIVFSQGQVLHYKAQEPRLQFCRRQVFHCKLRNKGSSFTRDWIGAVASRYFSQYYRLYIFIISVLPKGRSFSANTGTRAAILPKDRSSIANSGTLVAVLLGMNRCGSFPLISATHSLFSIWTNLKKSEKIPGAPTRRWGEWICLTGPSGLHRNSPQGLNISYIRAFNVLGIEIIITTIITVTKVIIWRNSYNIKYLYYCHCYGKKREATAPNHPW